MDVNTIEPQYQSTPLLLAAQNGHAQLLDLLLKHGANVNARDRWGYTALALAALGGPSLDQKSKHRVLQRSIVSALLDAGADVQTQNNNSETPILGVCLNGDVEVFERMRKAGAGIDNRAVVPNACGTPRRY